MNDQGDNGNKEVEIPKTQEGSESKGKRPRKVIQRSFPASGFEEALEIPLAIQKFSSGTKIRRLRLFELLGLSPESGPSRQSITNAYRYGLIKGNYHAEWLELTPDGQLATAENTPQIEKLSVWFSLAIERIPPFMKLYQHYLNNRVPVKSIMIDFLRESGFAEGELSECVDTFLLNARFVGVLKNISGADRIVPYDYDIDQLQKIKKTEIDEQPVASMKQFSDNSFMGVAEQKTVITEISEPWENLCFYISPIGEESSEQRKHSDLFLGSIIEPALEEFGLKVVRADQITASGIISRQIIEHIVKSRLVIADLSFHNPNVFYELAIRHAYRKPTIHLIRTVDKIPFDVNQVRTIQIDTSSIYSFVPQLDYYRSAIASQVRRALENPDTIDNPLTTFSAFIDSEK